MGLITPLLSAFRRRSLARRVLWLALPIGLLAGGGSGPNRGIRVMNGMRAYNGLASGGGAGLAGRVDTSTALPRAGARLMATAEERTTAGYLVRCAVPEGRSISLPDANGELHTFPGQVGLAPEWEKAACGPTCQRWVSACMLSLINTTGQHQPIWMVASHPAIGWGRDADLPLQEGAFFGNLFTTPATASYCAGRDFGISPIPGRIGSPQAAAPHAASRGPCASHCVPHGREGFKSCAGWNEVITVWHH